MKYIQIKDRGHDDCLHRYLRALAAQAESFAIRNCTWCHGGSAQGYTPAPRLAGQRPGYIEQQLISFATTHAMLRFRRQYMWGAAASLGPQAAHDLAVYFSRLPRRARQ